MSPEEMLERARRCLQIEVDALAATREKLDQSFADAVHRLAEARQAGRKTVTVGVGKSANIAEKAAATFSSIGMPAIFLDPVRAMHGDLGLCAEGDIALCFSNSGETEELVRLLPLLRRFGVGTILLTSRPQSTLSGICDLVLLYQVPREACPLNLAPTASTTAALAMADALAMVLLEQTGLTRDDFARHHPAGNLGRKLLLSVREVMRTGERFPVLPENITIREAIIAMTRAKAGSIVLVEADNATLAGILTDGDLRRHILTRPDFLDQPVADFMTRDPVVVTSDALLVEALQIFERHRIDDLVVVDKGRHPVGLIDGQDLPRFRIV